MTKQNFLEIMNDKNFYTAMQTLKEECPVIRTYDEIWEVITATINEHNIAHTKYLLDNLNEDCNWYLMSSETLLPIHGINDVECLFAEAPAEELTTEKVKQFIKENNVDPSEVFDDWQLIKWMAETHEPNDVYEDDALCEYVRYNCDMCELYDPDDIVDWVKENRDINDLIETDFRWS